VGHAPESLEINDREYAHQIVRFFEESFAAGTIEVPEVEFEAKEAGDGFRVAVTVESKKARPLQIALADAEGHLAFARVRAEAGTTTRTVETPFRPDHASAVEFRYVRPSGDGEWEPELSQLSSDLRDFKDFRDELNRHAGDTLRIVRDGDTMRFYRNYEPSAWTWASENLPDPAEVHERIRPRYSKLLAQVAAGLEEAPDSEAAARAMVRWLPEDPAGYHELGNAVIHLGLKDRLVAEGCIAAARARLRAGEVGECRRLLRAYLKVLPKGEEPRITAEDIEAITAGTDPASLGGE
jgi:hypothetical protein